MQNQSLMVRLNSFFYEIIRIVFCVILIFIVICCTTKTNPEQESDRLNIPKDPVSDKFQTTGIVKPVEIPSDLPAYFQSISDKGYSIPYHGDSAELVTPVIRSFTLLQEYADGKRDYPGWIVRQSLETMAFEIGYAESHGGDDLSETFYFFEEYLAQACRLCPDIEILTSVISKDKEIGVLTFRGWDSSPLQSYLIFKNKTAGFYQYTKWLLYGTYQNIYSFDRNGIQYYLLVSPLDYRDPHISLVSLTENAPKGHLEPLSDDVYNFLKEMQYVKDEQLIFDPSRLEWKQCKMNENGYWVEFPGSKTLTVDFGNTIQIIMTQ